MINIGAPLTELPIDVARERDVEVFDGPLLVLYRNGAGDPFLEKWCDRSGKVDRWLLFRTTELELTRFEFAKETLRNILLRAPDGYGFVRDTSDGRYVRVAMLRLSQLPNAYVPDAESYHDQCLNPRLMSNPDEQSFLIDGQWEPDNFERLDRKYKQAYSFMAAFGCSRLVAKNDLASAFSGWSFASGWNYKTAFDQLQRVLPLEKRAKLNAVHYSSPGYVRFSVDGDVAEALRESLRVLQTSSAELRKKYAAAHRLVIDIGRDAERYQYDKKGLREQEAELHRRLEDLLTLLPAVDLNAVLSAAGSAYIAGELVVTFVRRMESLFAMSQDGTAELTGLGMQAEDEDEVAEDE